MIDKHCRQYISFSKIKLAKVKGSIYFAPLHGYVLLKTEVYMFDMSSYYSEGSIGLVCSLDFNFEEKMV